MAKIKICGLKRPCDVDFVNEGKPDFAGFIINVPGSSRNVSPSMVRALRSRLEPDILPVGVFVDSPLEEILPLVEDGTIGAVQLHGNEDEQYIKTLRQALDKLRTPNAFSGTGGSGSFAGSGSVPIIKAYRIDGQKSVEEAISGSADHILLDSGNGGTGNTFDWSLLAGVKRPFFLAGGLTAENLTAAIKAVNPYAVDLSSGVETGRDKDKDKILAAIAAVRSIT